jgi:hypothetical protein
MVGNSTTLLCDPSSSSTASSCVSLARTLPNRMGKPSVFFSRLTTVCALYLFIVQLLHSFGQRPCPRQRSSSTGAHAVPLASALHTSCSLVSPQTTPSSTGSAHYATPT